MRGFSFLAKKKKKMEVGIAIKESILGEVFEEPRKDGFVKLGCACLQAKYTSMENSCQLGVIGYIPKENSFYF